MQMTGRIGYMRRKMKGKEKEERDDRRHRIGRARCMKRNMKKKGRGRGI